MIYLHSSDVIEAMKTASEYDRETKLKHVLDVLLDYEKVEADKKAAILLIKNKPYKR